MKERPVTGLILKMSLPMLISMLVNSLYNIVDSFFVAKISEAAMTALSLVFPVQNLINAVMIGFGVGINAVISFYLGAGESKLANKSATLGLFFATLHGIILTFACIFIMPSFLALFTNDETILELGIRYSNIAFSFSVMLAWELVFEKTFQAVGMMTVSMVCMMAGCIANIILDPVLIFGPGIFPAMGIKGAALATGLGQTLSAVIYFIWYIVKPINVKFGKKYMVFERTICKKLYAVGIPATLNMALSSFLISALNVILAGYSQVYVFVLGVYYKLQTFLYLPANGIVQGMRPLIGYNYGAGEHDRVKKIYKVVTGMIAAIMAVGTIVCLVVPDKLISLFTENNDTVIAGAYALRIISAGFVASSVSVVSCGALEGLGKGMESLVISLCRYVIIIIPVAHILGRLFGGEGVWNAFWITEVITAVISYWVYYHSRR